MGMSVATEKLEREIKKLPVEEMVSIMNASLQRSTRRLMPRDWTPEGGISAQEPLDDVITCPYPLTYRNGAPSDILRDKCHVQLPFSMTRLVRPG